MSRSPKTEVAAGDAFASSAARFLHTEASTAYAAGGSAGRLRSTLATMTGYEPRATGWMLQAQGAIDTPTLDYADRGYLLLVTDKTGKSGEKWEYVIVDEAKGNDLAKHLNEAAAEGYELVNAGTSMGTVLAVLKRPKPVR